MQQDSRPESEMEQISTGGATFLIRKWLPLTPLIFCILISFLTSKQMWRWDFETAGRLAIAVIAGLCFYGLVRYFVSGFADVVWINDSQIRFKKDGQTATTPLTNIEELRSSQYFPLTYPFSLRQYRIRLRFTEPFGMGKQIQFFLWSPGFHSKAPRDELDRLLRRIKDS
ncbi:hypothetical protein Pan153_44170 [Gimesia panareensis]|uniref:Uncharacterized protein n=1 Tax=Gimesia panareensis TaxID=2527978 RepID=A0A518FTT3_9PLAN|nr:hypothetical protein Pan153_44170 [Gimesia panareensis]